MLSAQNRMRSGSDFSAAVRRGRRAGRQSVVLHCLTTPADRPAALSAATSALVGFVVPKSVGNSVVRNRVQRRLRHLMRERITSLPSGARLVVRALPASAETEDLGAELDRALSVVLRPGSARSDRSARDSRETRGAS